MAEKSTIARPYAKAAFEQASAHKAFDRWSQALGAAAQVVADDRVATLLTNPRVTAEQLIDFIKEVTGKALDEQATNFLRTLAENRRLGLLPEIAAMYEELRAAAENIADVQVVSALPLDEAQRQKLAAALRKRLQREVRLHVDVDASLIGGAIARAGDLVIDGSLKARLERLTSAVAQ